MQKVKEIFSGDSKNAESTSSPRSSVGGSTTTANSTSLSGLNSGAATSHGTTGTAGTVASGTTASPARKIATEVETGGASRTTAAPQGGVGQGVAAHGHDHTKFASLADVDAKTQTHDHKHLAAKTHERQHEHTVEEVQRERTHDRHVHHVQHHVQPVLDVQHREEVHHNKVHPASTVKESHVNTKEDIASYAALGNHKDTVEAGEKHHQVIDKGEIVHENVSHHVHHVVQPVIERDTHAHHKIHTTVPVHHVSHEAPIVHQSSTHEPMHLADFTKGGGVLDSTLTHDKAGVLATGDCARETDGPAESLAQKLHLK